MFENVIKTVASAGSQAAGWAARNPRSTAGIAGGVVVAAVPVLVAGPFLAIAGFGATGVGAGTIAAGVQAGIGNVAAGTVFAALQSAGAGGAGLAVVNGVVSGGAVAAAGVAWAKSRFFGR